MKKFFRSFLLSVALTAASWAGAQAQSYGTVSLNSGAASNSPTSISAAVNTALQLKGDATNGVFTSPTLNNPVFGINGASAIITALGYSPVRSVATLTGIITENQLYNALVGTSANTLAAGNDSRITGACQTTGCTMTGALVPTGGLLGSTTGAFPAAGYIGQFLTNSATISIAASTDSAVTGLTLTPGGYWCQGNISYGALSAAAALLESFLSVSAPTPVAATENVFNFTSGIISSYTQMPTMGYPIDVTTNTSIYVYAYANVSASSVNGYIACIRTS